ncbi:fimbria/pilus outer membrane usher protein [Enterobacter ludwigii]
MMQFKAINLSIIAGSMLAILNPGSVHAELYFPRSMLSDTLSVADLGIFEDGHSQLPGDYTVDIYVNGKKVKSSVSVSFKQDADNTRSSADTTGLAPCLSRKWFIEQGVVTLGKNETESGGEGECLLLKDISENAHTEFDFENMNLNISIPQAMMKSQARDEVPDDLWEHGITALFINYRLSGDHTQWEHATNGESQFYSFDSGLNLGPWRFRDSSVYSRYRSGNNVRSGWEHSNTYITRPIIPLRSQLTLGDSNTLGDIFDGMSFRGFSLSTDEEMYPNSLRGYAPVIHGIAQSNARVVIRQNGYSIYQTYVPPGPFEIRDLYSMASSGDLLVEVSEENGRVRRFTVPYSAVPVLQRPGFTRYSVTAGQYRNKGRDVRHPNFIEATIAKGLDNNVTAYGGVQAGTNYKSLGLGGGVNLGKYGAVSGDITHARSRLADGSEHSGQSLRFLYARSFNSLGTTFQLTGYRYSTQGFYSFEDTTHSAMTGRVYDDAEHNGLPKKEQDSFYYDLNSHKRQRLVANVSQKISDYGSLYLSGSRQSYWAKKGTESSWQAGFSGNLWKASYSLSYGYTKTPWMGAADKSFSFQMSLPLNELLSVNTNHSIYATTSYNNNGHRDTTFQTGLNGTLLEENNLNWRMSQGIAKNNGNSQRSSSLGGAYQGGYGLYDIGYSRSKESTQLNYGVSGGIVLHNEGVTFSQPLGDTNILVAAPGASDLKVDNQTGIHTDWRGYTVIPSASSYRRNRVSLNTSNLNDNIELENNVSEVVPTRGALVKADFNSKVGYRAVFTLKKMGNPLLFGTMVTAGDESGIVGDGGQVYLSGLPVKGKLKAKWGEQADQTCRAEYTIQEKNKKQPIVTQEINCI